MSAPRRRTIAATCDEDANERARLERGDAFGELVALAANNGVVVDDARRERAR